jgi:hypothetical protein
MELISQFHRTINIAIALSPLEWLTIASTTGKTIPDDQNLRNGYLISCVDALRRTRADNVGGRMDANQNIIDNFHSRFHL